MKRFLSLALSAALLCTLGGSALAAEAPSADARLTSVTEKVKMRLGLDTSDYSSFHGDLEDGTAAPVWNLQWSGESGQLMISATESGKILNYNNYEDGMSTPAHRPSFGATFPKLSRADAQNTAQAFLDKALDAGVETAEFENRGSDTLSAISHSFYGTVLENGLPSPLSFRVSVRVSDNTVTGFYLSGGYESYMAGVPMATPAADAAKAGDSLKSTLKLRLEYVLQEDGKTALLRYLPESTHEYYVDAQTGKQVDLSALEQELYDRGGAMGGLSAPSAAPDADNKELYLTEAEQSGVAQLEGVLSKEKLDEAARKYTALGLSKYTLATASYRVDKENGDVTANLQYAYKSGDSIYRRNISLNAKTGALLAVSSSRPWKDGEKASVSEKSAQAKAEAFLKELCPDQFAKTALYENPAFAGSPYKSVNTMTPTFAYAAKENGYFLPDSSITVGIDGSDGSVSAYYNNYVDGVAFQSPDGIVDMAHALNSWFKTYDVELGYLAVPEKLDLSEPQWKPLIEMGRKYLYTQKLAYYLARDSWYLGVDAKTGEAVKGEEYTESTINYDDLGGQWVKAQAEKLAQYGVGWTGGSLKPGLELTQLDMVALLVSTGGYLYHGDSGNADAVDELYNIAYSMGVLEKKDRNEVALITRAQLVKLLLDSAGYGNLAGLEGIFKCSFADQSSIPAALYGYAAVAQGLGLVKGSSGGNFAPNRTATRAEAVSMLYNFMSR